MYSSSVYYSHWGHTGNKNGMNGRPGAEFPAQAVGQECQAQPPNMGAVHGELGGVSFKDVPMILL